MKTVFISPKIRMLMMCIFLINIVVSCKDQKDGKNNIEDSENFAGSSKRDDICQLISIDDIRKVFKLDTAMKIEQKENHAAICSYEWEAAGEKFMFYSVSLNFASNGKRTDSQMEDAWEKQNELVYKKHQPQNVPGVGDKASWSKLGGGQLRVASNGYLFYVSLSVIPNKNNPMDTQEMIDKTSVLAKLVIDNM